MPTDPVEMERLAGQVRAALESADLIRYRELLDPDVRWGAPDDTGPGCRNRDQVLAWYRRGRAKGIRATVTDTVVRGDKILVSLRIGRGRPSTDGGGPTLRWQILTVQRGRIVDIRGFDDRATAVARLD